MFYLEVTRVVNSQYLPYYKSMKLNKTRTRGLIVLLMLVLLGSYRGIQVGLSQVKTGEVRTSPDGRFIASVMEAYAETFWGQRKHWLEFSLTGKDVNRLFKTDYIEGPYFGSRSSYSLIYWADDSSKVRFVFPDAELVIKTSASE